MTLDFEALKNSLISIMRSFVEGHITAVEFEKQYTELWKEYRDSDKLHELNKAFSGIFDSMFTTLDCFCSDADLRDADDLDEQQLLSCVQNALSRLKRLEYGNQPVASEKI